MSWTAVPTRWTERGCAGRCWAFGGVQMFGVGAGGGGLGGVLLQFTEFGDGFGERCQPGDEHDGRLGAATILGAAGSADSTSGMLTGRGVAT